MFRLQQLPDLAFREIAQCMEPLDILHLTQTSFKTRCLISRNARLPIELDVHYWDSPYVSFSFRGGGDRIRFDINPTDDGPLSSLLKFGKGKESWSEASYYDDDLDTFGTHWDDTFIGLKTIIDFLADIFSVKSVSFDGRSEQSYNLLQHIVARNLPIQELQWDSMDSPEAIAQSVLEIATAAKKFSFITPPESPFQFDRLPEYALDSISFFGAKWLTGSIQCSLDNCLEVEIIGSKFTGSDMNYLLKKLVGGTGRARKWDIQQEEKYELETVLEGIKFEEIKKDVEYIIKRDDGTKMNVKYATPRYRLGPGKKLEVKVLDP